MFPTIFAPHSRPKQLVSTAQLLDSRTSPYHPAGHDIVAEPNHLQTKKLRETAPKCYAMLWIHELLWILCSWKDAQKIGKSKSGSWTSWVLPCETASSAILRLSTGQSTTARPIHFQAMHRTWACLSQSVIDSIHRLTWPQIISDQFSLTIASKIIINSLYLSLQRNQDCC